MQNELDNYQKYIETVRDYWVTRAQIQRVVGGRLPPVSQMDKMGHSSKKTRKLGDNPPARISKSFSDIESQDKIIGKQDNK
jgi:hypothetical protein